MSSWCCSNPLQSVIFCHTYHCLRDKDAVSNQNLRKSRFWVRPCASQQHPIFRVGTCPNLLWEKIGMFQRPNCCSFCDIFRKNLRVENILPPPAINRVRPMNSRCHDLMKCQKRLIIFVAFDEMPMHRQIQANSSRRARQECTSYQHSSINIASHLTSLGESLLKCRYAIGWIVLKT